MDLFAKMLHPETTLAMLILPFPTHANREARCGEVSFILNGEVFYASQCVMELGIEVIESCRHGSMTSTVTEQACWSRSDLSALNLGGQALAVWFVPGQLTVHLGAISVCDASSGLLALAW
jgi:hypothetical protein